VVGLIHHLPALDDFTHKAVAHLQSLSYLPRRAHEQIHRQHSHRAHNVAKNNSRLTEGASLEWHHHQQINIRIRMGPTVGVGTKKHDLLGMKLTGNRVTQTSYLFLALLRAERLR
jgi:hypothetical protein